MHDQFKQSQNENEPEKTVVIIGGGPAGLTAAYELGKVGVTAIVLEKSGDVGGISRTVRYKDFRFDIGGHRFYTKVRAVEEFWHEILSPPEFPLRKRLSRIFYKRKFFRYPIQATDALRKLGLVNSALILLSYFQAKIFPYKNVQNFEQNICNRFGRRLYNTFFKSYTEKVWGIPCDQISSEWANQRIHGLGLGSALKKALLQHLKKAPQQKSAVIKTLIDEFHYPLLGPGQMWETVAQRVAQNGGELRFHSAVERILWNENGVQSLEVSNGKSKVGESKVGELSKAESSTRMVAGSHFLSSMPIAELVQKLDPPAPQNVQEAAGNLHYRDFLTVALIVKRREVFPDNWIYIHEPEVTLGRIQNFKNWSADMVPDENKTCLGLEYFCFEGDGLWSKSDEELIELGTRELEILGLVKATDVEDGAVVRQPKAYPVYDEGYENALDTVRHFVESLGNLQLVGRNGMHRYNNQDHSMLTAMLAAKNILGANYDLWSVNAEQEYHEEIKIADEENPREFSSADISRLNATQPHVPQSVQIAKETAR